MGPISMGRLTSVAVVMWIGLLLYSSTILVQVHQGSKRPASDIIDKNEEKNTGNNGVDGLPAVLAKLSNADKDLEILRSENRHLRAMVSSLNATIDSKNRLISSRRKTAVAPERPVSVLNSAHEVLRRSIQNGITELWFATSSKLRKLQESARENKKLAEDVELTVKELTEQQRTLKADSEKWTDLDDKLRQMMLANITDIVQNRIAHLQNPSDCKQAKKLVCQLNKGCGFGCQLHHAVYCLIVAYATERTMILDSQGWRYSSKGWNSIFLPVSNSCTTVDEPASFWRVLDQQSDVKVVQLPIIDSLNDRPPQLPLSFPADLAERLITLHGNPAAWWVGQFAWYLMRYQPDFERQLNIIGEKQKFATPCVGIHVRRTDKVGSEAAFHSLDEYMQFAADWFHIQALKNSSSNNVNGLTKRIYMATDEPSLFEQARKSFAEYTFFGDPEVARTAQVASRYTDASLRGIVVDIHFLSRCDYLVCTFSSQVCRIAYELMQVLRGDAASRFHSLDDIYYFGGQSDHVMEAVQPHIAASAAEIDLKVGDKISIAGNHWDGYSKGQNSRTGMSGLFPSYKVKEHWQIVKFPTYPQATNRLN